MRLGMVVEGEVKTTMGCCHDVVMMKMKTGFDEREREGEFNTSKIR